MNALIKIVRVKQVMCFLATRLTQEFLVKHLDIGVLMALAFSPGDRPGRRAAGGDERRPLQTRALGSWP